ncbi:histone-lysine N-methyltransferase SETD1B-like [Scyliorhinus canicula]|uniref:histone-lysine N-methyltransferase SETD1B-like n=1 Tax=Scyliorhinus canicula TaxID=7830 RepID=UPI0018F6F706|nr:histone-lysine N-methyltransferase SETD1B-like [Scyliorhinus canicula]XP_038635879.1 histone-lysine N-methyltransferase SETD1B-like [Scyliorhinus canicula]
MRQGDRKSDSSRPPCSRKSCFPLTRSFVRLLCCNNCPPDSDDANECDSQLFHLELPLSEDWTQYGLLELYGLAIRELGGNKSVCTQTLSLHSEEKETGPQRFSDAQTSPGAQRPVQDGILHDADLEEPNIDLFESTPKEVQSTRPKPSDPPGSPLRPPSGVAVSQAPCCPLLGPLPLPQPGAPSVRTTTIELKALRPELRSLTLTLTTVQQEKGLACPLTPAIPIPRYPLWTSCLPSGETHRTAVPWPQGDPCGAPDDPGLRPSQEASPGCGVLCSNPRTLSPPSIHSAPSPQCGAPSGTPSSPSAALKSPASDVSSLGLAQLLELPRSRVESPGVEMDSPSLPRPDGSPSVVPACLPPHSPFSPAPSCPLCSSSSSSISYDSSDLSSRPESDDPRPRPPRAFDSLRWPLDWDLPLALGREGEEEEGRRRRRRAVMEASWVTMAAGRCVTMATATAAAAAALKGGDPLAVRQLEEPSEPAEEEEEEEEEASGSSTSAGGEEQGSHAEESTSLSPATGDSQQSRNPVSQATAAPVSDGNLPTLGGDSDLGPEDGQREDGADVSLVEVTSRESDMSSQPALSNSSPAAYSRDCDQTEEEEEDEDNEEDEEDEEDEDDEEEDEEESTASADEKEKGMRQGHSPGGEPQASGPFGLPRARGDAVKADQLPPAPRHRAPLDPTALSRANTSLWVFEHFQALAHRPGLLLLHAGDAGKSQLPATPPPAASRPHPGARPPPTGPPRGGPPCRARSRRPSSPPRPASSPSPWAAGLSAILQPEPEEQALIDLLSASPSLATADSSPAGLRLAVPDSRLLWVPASDREFWALFYFSGLEAARQLLRKRWWEWRKRKK